MAHTNTWNAANEASPASTDNLGQGDGKIRQLKLDLRERIAKDHYMDIAGTDTDHGEHSKITFQAQIAKPAAVANKGFIYIKDVSAKAELHWEDEDGNELAITSAGALAGVAAAIAAAVAACKTALFPVGSIFTSTSSTNPGTLLGFGTWAAFGAGRVIVGVGTSDAAYAAAATGGESTHLLTAAETGSRDHHHHIGEISGAGSLARAWGDVGSGDGGGHSSTSGSNLGDANASSAHNNMPPYVVAYMWQRTA